VVMYANKYKKINPEKIFQFVTFLVTQITSTSRVAKITHIYPTSITWYN